MNEQLTLFDNFSVSKEDLAQKNCDEFNSLDTVWKGTFKVTKVELSKWEHIADPNKILSISLSPVLNGNYLIQFEGDKKSQRNIYNADRLSPFIKKLSQDKDFSYCITPWSIYIYWHKFERKKVDLT